MATLAAHPELARQRIHRIVAPHILDKGEDFAAATDGAAMDGTGHLVGFVMSRQRLEQGVEGALFKLGRRQEHPFELLHHAAIHGALTAAGGDRLLLQGFVEIGGLLAAHHGGGLALPVDDHRLDGRNILDKALILEITQHQRLGAGPQCHQGYDLLPVEVDRQWPLTGDLAGLQRALLIHHLDGHGELGGCIAFDKGRCHGPLATGCRDLRGGIQQVLFQIYYLDMCFI